MFKISQNNFMMPEQYRTGNKKAKKGILSKADPFKNTLSYKKEKPKFLNPEPITDDSMISQIAKQMKDKNKTEKILKKIARGEHLSEEEMAYLEKIEPEKIQKAKAANLRRKEIERQMANAKNKEEAEKILLMAKQEALTAVSGKHTQEYGEYLVAAIQKTEEKFYKGKPLGKDESGQEGGLDIRI